MGPGMLDAISRAIFSKLRAAGAGSPIPNMRTICTVWQNDPCFLVHVRTLLDAPVHPQLKVCVFLRRPQLPVPFAFSLGIAVDDAFHDAPIVIAGLLGGPASQILAVEERHDAIGSISAGFGVG